MGILDKLAFWKKKEEFDLGELRPVPGEEKLGIPGIEKPAIPGEAPFEKELPPEPGAFPEEPSAFPKPTPPPEIPEEPTAPALGGPPGGPPTAPPRGYMPPPTTSRDVELLSAKLDTIKATLESINQRLANIERLARTSEHEIY